MVQHGPQCLRAPYTVHLVVQLGCVVVELGQRLEDQITSWRTMLKRSKPSWYLGAEHNVVQTCWSLCGQVVQPGCQHQSAPASHWGFVALCCVCSFLITAIVLPAKEDLLTVTFLCCQLKWGGWQFRWFRGERRACHNEVITCLKGFSGSGLATQSGLHCNGW